jgi:prepilin peptidase CpaA
MKALITVDSGLVQIFGYILEVHLVLLLALLATAIAIDVRSHRIPNVLVGAGLATGIALQLLLPAGWGALYALKGAAVGFAFFVPLYALRTVGAGDVKLMTMVGTFLGPSGTVDAALATLLAGGLLAVAAAAWHGALQRLFANVIAVTSTGKLARVADGALISPVHSAGKVPYAVAIAAGTCVQILLARHGLSLIA